MWNALGTVNRAIAAVRFAKVAYPINEDGFANGKAELAQQLKRLDAHRPTTFRNQPFLNKLRRYIYGRNSMHSITHIEVRYKVWMLRIMIKYGRSDKTPPGSKEITKTKTKNNNNNK